jgi:thiol:disulfide interchange protein
VLTVQSGPMALARLFVAAVVLALAVWMLGVAQRRRASGGRPLALAGAGSLLAVAAAAAVLWPAYDAADAADDSGAASAAVPYEAYSPERVAALRSEGKTVFVNFTAAWCVTCQVNERIALSRQAVADAFDRTGAVYLKADWTRKDAVIEAELARYGRAGVPLYLVYGPGGGEAVILPQVLTEGLVIRALEDATAS